MSPDLFSLAGRLALITGSGQGIGLTLARGLASAGACIVLNDIVQARLDAAVEGLRAEGIDAHGSLFDVTVQDEVLAAVADIEERLGPIEILVNNAGIQHRTALEDFPAEAWHRLLAVNVTGVFYVSQAVARRMIPRGHGKVICIASMQSELARPTIAPYTATKGAVKNFVKGMCTDWAKYGIQVNGIGPGYFITELTRPLADNPEFDAWLRARTPAARWGDTSELVGAAIFLASDASSFVNGQIVYVDGGMLASV
jgi:gluconate 5-dehydrogenase